MGSQATVSAAHIVVTAKGWARFLALAPLPLRILRENIESDTISTASEVGQLLGWRIGGAAVSRTRAIGWFTIRGRRKSWAWVWLTPNREVRLIRLKVGRVRLVAIPTDWFTD